MPTDNSPVLMHAVLIAGGVLLAVVVVIAVARLVVRVLRRGRHWNGR